MKTLCVDIADKIATYRKRTGAIICGNSDYQVKFTFDGDWDAYTAKTARFIWNGQYVDVDFTGNVCPAPMVQNTEQVSVGVYAGDLCTTTPAVIDCKKSILCSGVPASDEMREQYVDEAKAAADRAEDAADRAEEAAERAEAGGGGGGGGTPGKPGLTPHIGSNGNWWIGEIDTGVKAEGKDGNGIREITLAQQDQDEYGRTWRKYRIHYTDNTTFDYIVWDGSSPTITIEEPTEYIDYSARDGLVAIPEGATKVNVTGTCSGYMSGGNVYFVLVDGSRNIIANAIIASGSDVDIRDVLESLEIPEGAVYFGTYPFDEDQFDDNRNNGYSCNLSAEFSEFENSKETIIRITDEKGSRAAVIKNGEDGITPHIGANGNWWVGETDTGVKAEGKDGKGIKSIARTSGTGAPGTNDTYTITYTDNTTSTFTVYNGKNGADGKSIDRISYMASGTDSAGRVEHYYDVFVDDTVIGGITVTDGKDGADGKSAYTYAKEGGYKGTEEEFYAKMAQEIPTKVSAFDNDSEYIKASEAPVQSVNGKTGAVSLSAADVGARPSTWTPTYSDVGAEKSGAASSVMNAHNTNGGAHNDIRLLIEGLATRLNSLANSTDEDLDQMAEVVAYIKSNKTLIDSITTSKVSVADIVNNLTTNATNKPLSAAQGVALKALIDAITVPTKVSQLDNDAKYLTSYTESDPTVPAWAKTPSKPSYSKSEVGLGNVENVKQYSASNPPPYPVKSVNGQTGEVTIAVPTKTSELENDSKYVTDAKAETWTFKLKDGSTVTKKVVLG